VVLMARPGSLTDSSAHCAKAHGDVGTLYADRTTTLLARRKVKFDHQGSTEERHKVLSGR
jgi:hypothetical protein